MEITGQPDATDDFYCRSYCLLNMFRAQICPSSGAREYYTSVCCLWYLVLWFSSCRYGVELNVMWPVCRLSKAAACKPDTKPSAPHHTDNLKTKAPNTTGSDHLYNTLELLMMGIMVPETCWASNKIYNKFHLLHLVGILFPYIPYTLCNLTFATVVVRVRRCTLSWNNYFHSILRPYPLRSI